MKKTLIFMCIFTVLSVIGYSEEFSAKEYSKIIIKELKEYISKEKKKHSLYNGIMILDRADAILGEYSEYYSHNEKEIAKQSLKELDSFSPVRTKYTKKGLHIVLISSAFTPKLWHYSKEVNKIRGLPNAYEILDGVINSDTYKKVIPVEVLVEDLSNKNTEMSFSIKVSETDVGYEKSIVPMKSLVDKEVLNFSEKNKIKVNISNKLTIGKWNLFMFDDFDFRKPVVEIKIDGEDVKIE